MKKKISLILLSAYLLSSCTLINYYESSETKESDSISQSESISESEQESESESDNSESSEEQQSESESESEEESESESESETTPQPAKLNLTVYASNDFHGAVMEDSSSIGLEYYGTFMKERRLEDNTLTIDQGDTWQGIIY